MNDLINQWDMAYHQSRPAMKFDHAHITTYTDVYWTTQAPCHMIGSDNPITERALIAHTFKLVKKTTFQDRAELPPLQEWHSMETLPYQYCWVGDITPVPDIHGFIKEYRNVVFRRRHVTLTQLSVYDLNHPLIAPQPKVFSRVALAKLRDTGVIHPRARITQDTGKCPRHTDFYDIVDVIYAIHMKKGNGHHYDMPRIAEFWGIRLGKYAEVDAKGKDE